VVQARSYKPEGLERTGQNVDGSGHAQFEVDWSQLAPCPTQVRLAGGGRPLSGRQEAALPPPVEWESTPRMRAASYSDMGEEGLDTGVRRAVGLTTRGQEWWRRTVVGGRKGRG
jgi:hypothetical protein